MNNQEELLNFCHNVKTVRQREGLSKKKMSEMMGISQHSLNLIERGIVPERLSINKIMCFCFAFGIQIKDAFKKL